MENVEEDTISVSAIPKERIEQMILLIRGQKVILDAHLALLYEVSLKRFNESVKRNLKRFPKDFMFQLTREEYEILKSQIATSRSWGGRRYLPYVFTEYGVAMLSGVLNSDQAINVNIEIMRTFGKLRSLLLSHGDLIRRLDELENKYDEQFRTVFGAIRKLVAFTEEPKKPQIGF